MDRFTKVLLIGLFIAMLNTAIQGAIHAQDYYNYVVTQVPGTNP